MKYFIKKGVVFLIVLLISALCLDIAVSTGLKKSKTKLFSTFSKVYKGEIDAELIISGSSKAYVQIDPAILDSILGIKSYNLGLDGSPFIPQKALYEIYKQQRDKKPKVVVQIVSNGTLRSLEKGFLNPIKFAPYLDMPEIEDHMKLTSGFHYMDYKIPLLKYSGAPFEVLTGITSLFNIDLFTNETKNGYSPIDREWNKKFDLNVKNSNDDIESFIARDKASSALFEEFLSQHQSDNIKVFLVYPPIHNSYSHTVHNIDYYNTVAKKYNAHFLNYSQDESISNEKIYFYNPQHLNVMGATIFSKKLAEDIKKHL